MKLAALRIDKTRYSTRNSVIFNFVLHSIHPKTSMSIRTSKFGGRAAPVSCVPRWGLYRYRNGPVTPTFVRAKLYARVIKEKIELIKRRFLIYLERVLCVDMLLNEGCCTHDRIGIAWLNIIIGK